MLFDLRGPGRRQAVKIVYVTLAVLIGGGLVLFGVGGSVSGGLVDAITGSQGGGGGSATGALRDRAEQAAQRTRVEPKNAAAWAALARARFSLASANSDPNTGAFNAEGTADLRRATEAWQQHVKLADNPDPNVASIMVQAYIGLGNAAEAAAAQEIVAEDRNSAGTYAQLAQLEWAAGNTRLGDLARDKALDLTPKDMREALRGELDSAKASSPSASPTPTATATPTPEK
jgi:hypothetical protein